eukprot:5853759-Karenia_brevis.AAC.1
MAFKLPSPLGDSNAFQDMPHSEKQALQRDVTAGVRALFDHAKLESVSTLSEILKFLPSAEAHRKTGATTLEAWARASSYFPEYSKGRQ